MAVASVIRAGIVALVLCAVSGAGAFAQTRVGTVLIEGNERIPDATVVDLSGVTPGAVLSDDEINAALRNVLASGFFETARVRVGGGGLIFDVVERPTISRINIEGNERLDDEVLLDFLISEPRQVYSPSVAEADAATIVDAYAAQARLGATVTPRIIRRSDNRVDLVFEVTEARVVENERISFVGNRAFSDRRLRRVIDTKQAGFFRTLVGRDTFIPERIAFDSQLLRDFYLSRGYVDFEVLDVATELSRERDATFIQFRVREGQQFRVGEVSLSSEFPEVDAGEYAAALRLGPGEIWNPARIDEQVERLERLALRDGLDFLRADPRVTRNDAARTLDVEFALVRGPRIFVERIDIEGNQTTLDRVIRRQFDTVEGDPFNPRAIRNAASRIRALGFFSDVGVDTRQGTTPSQVIVDVDVEEQPTGNLSLGGSFSSDTGFGVSVGISERNFLGRGQRFSLDVLTADENSTVRISFAEPAFLGRDLTFGISAALETTDFDGAAFQTRTRSIEPFLRFPVSENGRLRVFWDLAEIETFDINEDTSPIIASEEGTVTRSSIGYSYTLDLLRGGLNPNRGVRLTFGQEYAGLGGSVDFLKTTARIIAERDVLNEEVTLRTVIEGGAIEALSGQNTRVGDRFFLGSRQLRGFASRGVGPRDTGAGISDVLGGNRFFSARFEADFPLGLPEEYGITGGVFMDFASLWDLDDTDGVEPVDDDFELRSSIGVSIFWSTPIGPLRLNFAQPIKKNELDALNTFDITISTQF